MTRSFEGSTFALLTQHGKEIIIAPILRAGLGAGLTVASGYDTDLLGTFSGEVDRTLSPAACALKKAELACQLSGLPFGLGSEGSFTTGVMGLGTVNAELISCLSVEEGWHVTGISVGPSAAHGSECKNAQDLETFLQGLPPQQRLILQSQGRVAKGLTSAHEVKSTLSAWRRAGTPYPLTISFDLRAHCCPGRRERIALAAENLVARLLSECPQCQLPGFWPDHKVLGLPCIDCNSASNALSARLARCRQCHHEVVYPVAEAWADPGLCPTCNP